jgi:membrane-bound lytic murein transglycosylase B
MKNIIRRYRFILLSCVAITAITFTLLSYGQKNNKNKEFITFIKGIRAEAIKLGVSEKTTDKYLTSLKAPRLKSVTHLKHQPEQELTLSQYLGRLLPPSKIKTARLEFKKNHVLLKKIAAKYHVQPQYIVALWGIESDFGKNAGKFPLIQSLATLAFQHHRSPFYKYQLLMALKILDKPLISDKQTLSSWAGAMGQTQFMPDTYLHYAVDFNNDGVKDIWGNLPDILASIANFLHQNGWSDKTPWGSEATLPKNFQSALAGTNNQLALATWLKLGVKPKKPYSQKIDPKKTKASVVIMREKGAPAYLVFNNFRVLLRWNQANLEALAVGTLADKIVENQ